MNEELKYYISSGEKNSGDTLVLIGNWDDSLRDVMIEKEIVNLRLSRSAGWNDEDVFFLKTLPFLKGLEVYADDIKDLSAMKDLKLLEYLGLDCNLAVDLDFYNFRNLTLLQLSI